VPTEQQFVTSFWVSRQAIIGLAIAAILLVAGHALPGFSDNQIQSGIRNALHVIIFAAFAWLIRSRLSGIRPAIAALLTIGSVTIVAVGGEMLQWQIGGTPDAHDIIRDLAGAILIVGAVEMWRLEDGQKDRKIARLTTRTFAALLSALIFVPIGFWLLIIASGRFAFPSIATFDRWWEPYHYVGVNTVINRDGGIATFELHDIRRSGISIDLSRHDLSGFEHLAFVAAIEQGAATPLNVRINNRATKGNMAREFMYEVLIREGTADYRLAIDELIAASGLGEVDIADIRQLVLLAPRARNSTRMSLDNLRFE
jgi:hypothetical protein